MKKVLICLIAAICAYHANGQLIGEMEMVSPFHEGMASVKKAGQWAFIDNNGKVLIDFRDDLVPTEEFHEPTGNKVLYPVFKDDRCQIFKTEDGIKHFGFIDKKGKEVIPAQFVIDKDGQVITSLMNARHYLPEKIKKSPPPLQSVFLGDHLVGVLHENGQWSVYKF